MRALPRANVKRIIKFITNLAWREGDHIQDPFSNSNSSFAFEYAVYAATIWHIQPSIPPLPIQSPGAIINQKIALIKKPLYNCPNPGSKKLNTPAIFGLSIRCLHSYLSLLSLSVDMRQNQ